MSKYGVISGPYFPVFGLNTEIYFVNLRIQSEYRKIRTRNNSIFRHFSRSSTIANEKINSNSNISSDSNKSSDNKNTPDKVHTDNIEKENMIQNSASANETFTFFLNI